MILRLKPYGRGIGFDAALKGDDDDGERDSRVVWVGTKDDETDARWFGTVMLEPKPSEKKGRAWGGVLIGGRRIIIGLALIR